VSGCDDAVARMHAHLARRRGRRERVPPTSARGRERAWLESLSDRELGDYVRRLNQVDRAVQARRAMLEREAA
jgi:hypothetical protein